MESNGEALKIHISPQCNELLNKLGGYITEKRGVIPMKGKGDVLTYWLVGMLFRENLVETSNYDNLFIPNRCNGERNPKEASRLPRSSTALILSSKKKSKEY
jgi:guanylate cyclase